MKHNINVNIMSNNSSLFIREKNIYINRDTHTYTIYDKLKVNLNKIKF